MTSLRRLAVARASKVLAAGFTAAAVMCGCSPDSAVPTLTAPTPLPATMAPANDDPAPSTPAKRAPAREGVSICASCCENAAWLSNGSRTGQDRRSGLERRLQPAPRPQAANGITLVGFKGFKCGCRFSCRRGGREDTRMGVSPGGGGARLTRRESGGIPSVFRLIRNAERSGEQPVGEST